MKKILITLLLVGTSSLMFSMQLGNRIPQTNAEWRDHFQGEVNRLTGKQARQGYLTNADAQELAMVKSHRDSYQSSVQAEQREQQARQQQLEAERAQRWAQLGQQVWY